MNMEKDTGPSSGQSMNILVRLYSRKIQPCGILKWYIENILSLGLAQWGRMLIHCLLALASHIPYRCWFMSQLLHFRSSSLLTAWESCGGWPKFLGPCAHIWFLEEALGSWLHTGSVPTIVAIWGVNQRKEDSCVCPSLSHCLSLSLSLSLFCCNSGKYRISFWKGELCFFFSWNFYSYLTQ